MTLKINPAILQYHSDNRYYDIFVGRALEGKRKHIENVIEFTKKMLKFFPSNVNEELLMLCVEHHDDGRVNQMELIGKYWDSKVSHNVLGLERFDTTISGYDSVIIDDSIYIFRNVLLYHERMSLLANDISRPYVEIVSAVDNFENACSAVSYLLNEVENDVKGYKHDNPEMDQSTVSDFVFEHFSNGEVFDKIKYCNTYAEYVLYAATLVTSCIKRFGTMAIDILKQPAYGYSSILEGYKVIFEAVLTKADATRAYNILCGML